MPARFGREPAPDNVAVFEPRRAPTFRRDAPGNVFLRALVARILADVFQTSASRVAEECWPSDRALFEIVEKATSAPAMTGVTGWAAELVQRVVADALEGLSPASAAAEIMADGLSVAFDGHGVISIPGFTASASNASFVAEGDPIPVRQLAAAPGTMNPYKIAVIAVLTREMVESSNAEALVTDAFVRSCGLALDAVFFGSGAATSAQPAGIRNGISAIATSNNSDSYAAAYEDITNLLNAVSAVAGNGKIALVMGAGRAASVGMRTAGVASNVKVYGSSAVGNDVIAIALNGIASALSPTPDVETAKAAQLVMDTAPPVVGTTAAMNKSMFQTDSLALKIRWPVTWLLRSSVAVAWLTPSWK